MFRQSDELVVVLDAVVLSDIVAVRKLTPTVIFMTLARLLSTNCLLLNISVSLKNLVPLRTFL